MPNEYPGPYSNSLLLESHASAQLDRRIYLFEDNITNVRADAIVCPALPDLETLYIGVAGAILDAGGPEIFAEASAIGIQAQMDHPDETFPVPLYSAHLTNAGTLKNTRHVIHSVAVDYNPNTLRPRLSSSPQAIFRSAWNVLQLAHDNKLQSVAFPALGAGLYKVPVGASFGAIAQAADRFFKVNPETTLDNVMLVNYGQLLPGDLLPHVSLLEQPEVDALVTQLIEGRN